MAPNDEIETTEGMVWPMVVLVELGARQVAALRAELEPASIIVLVEGSMLRAAQLLTEQRPQVAVAPSSLPGERTKVLRDVAAELGLEVMLVEPDADPRVVLHDVRAAVARASASKKQAQGS